MNSDDRSLFLGIDPGQSGGLAILDSAGAVVDVSAMPSTERDISDYLSEFSTRIRHAVIERVHAMPRQGVASMFRFGMSYGSLRMALICHHIRFEAVTPGVWQRTMGCLRSRKTDSQTEHKRRTKARAQELFPSQRITHATADALLIAEYGRRVGR